MTINVSPAPAPRAARPSLVLAMLAMILVGCQSAPKKGPARPPPADIQPTQVLPYFSFFEDTNGNGYLDSSRVTIYLFSDAYSDASIMVPGTLSLRLTTRDGRVIREWKYTEDETARLVRRGPVGPGFVFVLSLLDNGGTDVIDDLKGELVAEIRLADGRPLSSVSNSVRIGRSGRP
ncbi:MAG: hypothetical protein SFY69_11040 [Planctomycetota bacterium]|nr:hypothetical protein [Planctomycetota bacterium]